MTLGGSDRLIAAIYSALVGEVGWDAFVDDVAAQMRTDIAVMFYHDAACGGGAVTLASGVDDRVMRDYAGYYSARNPWMTLLPSIPVGEGIVGEQVLARDSFLRTEYYNDFFRPNGQETSVGVTVRQDDGHFFLLSLLSGDGDFDRNRERARGLTRLAPHLRRASDFYRRQASGGLAERLGEAGGFAVVVVNPAARVAHASQAGEACLDIGKPLGIDAAGRLSFVDPMTQSVFEHVLRGRQDDLSVRTVTTGGTEVTFIRVAEDHGSAIFMGGTVAILIAGQENDTAVATQRIAARYGLTPAESRVLQGIVSGSRTADIAARGGVALETVRTQLKAIFAKTGTNRQSALVRLAAGLEGDESSGHG